MAECRLTVSDPYVAVVVVRVHSAEVVGTRGRGVGVGVGVGVRTRFHILGWYARRLRHCRQWPFNRRSSMGAEEQSTQTPRVATRLWGTFQLWSLAWRLLYSRSNFWCSTPPMARRTTKPHLLPHAVSVGPFTLLGMLSLMSRAVLLSASVNNIILC